LSVDNAPPTVTTATGDELTEQSTATVDASFVDPGVEDTHTVAVDWGDGTVETVAVDQGAGEGSVRPTHSYADSGEYTVTISLADDNGGTDTATVTVSVNDPVVFGGDGEGTTLPSTEGPATDRLPDGAVAVGSPTVDLDGDGGTEIPSLVDPTTVELRDTGGGASVGIDLGDDTAATQKTQLAVGSWNGSGNAVFYAGAEGTRIYRVTTDTEPVVIATADNGVDAVLNPADIDGDGVDELPFADGSQTLRYVEPSEDRVGTFTEISDAGVGSNNNLGVGTPADIDDDGTAEIPFVDGSNQLLVADADGVERTLVDTTTVAKTTTAVHDIDRDGELEILYAAVDGSETRLSYADGLGGTVTLRAVRDEDGVWITVDTTLGVH
jgi:hypothetical protein